MPPETAARQGALATDQPRGVLLGPGLRVQALGPHLELLGEGPAPEPLTDLAGALFGVPPTARLVVDADELPLEDLGFLRRFLAAGPGRELYLVGDDPRQRTARAFSGVERVRFLVWPPDLDQLAALATPPSGSSDGARGGIRTAAGAVRGRAGNGSDLGASAQLVEPLGAVHRELPGGAPERASALARIEKVFRSLKTALESSADLGPPVAACGEELERLVHWSRAAAAPRPPATARAGAPRISEPSAFDLSQMLEVVLAGVAVGGADAPRFLYRSRGELHAHGPREELAQSFEALFSDLFELAGSGSLIQVEASGAAGGTLPPTVSINFPGGPLEPDDVLRVYRADGRVEPDDPPQLAGLAGRVTHLASLGATVSFSSATHQRLVLELSFAQAASSLSSA